MDKELYNTIIELLDKHIIKNTMLINGISYNLIDTMGLKKDLKSLYQNDEEINSIIDKSIIQKR